MITDISFGGGGVTDIAIGNKVIIGEPLPTDTSSNNQMIYKTSDNKPVDFPSSYSLSSKVISNVYDEDLDACIMTFSEDLTEIPSGTTSEGFFVDCLTLIEIIYLPKTITKIGDSFLNGCNNLQSIDLSPLSNITSIGDYFLYICKALTKIDLSPLSQVTSIGNNFLSNCQNLVSIDLSGLSQLTSIGNKFLYNCSVLQSVSLSGLSKLNSIGDSFLYYNTYLTSLDLSGLSNLNKIGNSFLYNCQNLPSIDLSGLINVTSTGTSFLSGTPKLTTIDLSNTDKYLGLLLKNYNKNNAIIKVPVNLLSQYQSTYPTLNFEAV